MLTFLVAVRFVKQKPPRSALEFKVHKFTSKSNVIVFKPQTQTFVTSTHKAVDLIVDTGPEIPPFKTLKDPPTLDWKLKINGGEHEMFSFYKIFCSDALNFYSQLSTIKSAMRSDAGDRFYAFIKDALWTDFYARNVRAVSFDLGGGFVIALVNGYEYNEGDYKVSKRIKNIAFMNKIKTAIDDFAKNLSERNLHKTHVRSKQDACRFCNPK